MPFTLAHAAVALPSRRLRLVPSAVVAGAVAPDVWYYLPRAWSPTFPPDWSPHSWAGALTVDLAVALVLTVAWRTVLRRPWLALLPEPWASAAERACAAPVLRRPLSGAVTADVARVVASALIGVVTHLALDLVSHETRWEGPVATLLSTPLAGVALHDWLQVGLSVVGLALLGVAAWRWGRAELSRSGAPVRWARTSIAVLVVAVAAGALGALRRADLGGLPAAATPTELVRLLLGGTAGVVAVLLLYALAWWGVRLSRRPRRPAVPARSRVARPGSRTPG